MELTNKLWGFCNKLRHDGVDPSDYIEQLTYLLFLKIAEERGIKVPDGYDWKSLLNKDSKSLLPHLLKILDKLKTKGGILGDIFAEPVSRVRNAHILNALILEINSINWSGINADIVGIAFEELIGKVANEGKKGAGQYFTPRPLIQSIVNVIKPNPLENSNFKIGDVATGTAGFLVVAWEWFKGSEDINKLKKSDLNRIKSATYFGQELVQRPRRLALMNMFLHGISCKIKLGDTIYSKPDDQLFDCILTNPPFGNKGANQIPDRNFKIKTSDKQLNFIQHVITKLKKGGRAAIVLPDSCLSNDTSKKVWEYYLDITKSKENVCNLHTILKLPEGVFAAYANGIKACVIFIQKGYATKETWIYDGRTDVTKVTTKSNILSPEHFIDFEEAYGKLPNGNSKRKESERFKAYSFDEIKERKFDISFVEVYKTEDLPHPAIIIDKMIADYQNKINALQELKRKLPLKINESTKTLETAPAGRVGNFKKREKANKITQK